VRQRELPREPQERVGARVIDAADSSAGDADCGVAEGRIANKKNPRMATGPGRAGGRISRIRVSERAS
jgi:hypothetical protein